MDNLGKQKNSTDGDERISINATPVVAPQTFATTTPKKLGNCYALCYKGCTPLITIGPNCN